MTLPLVGYKRNAVLYWDDSEFQYHKIEQFYRHTALWMKYYHTGISQNSMKQNKRGKLMVSDRPVVRIFICQKDSKLYPHNTYIFW